MAGQEVGNWKCEDQSYKCQNRRETQCPKKRHPKAELLFVGAKGRMEMDRVPAAGYNIVGLPIVGFQVWKSWYLSSQKLKEGALIEPLV